ncbi:MAG TPA: MCE family protein [Mycobacterium sp.]
MTNPQVGAAKFNKAPAQPYRLAGFGVLLVSALVVGLVYLQYSGSFTAKTKIQMLSARAGLVMDTGAKVTYNGVQVGRVATIDEVQADGKPAAAFTLDVFPRYLKFIPANVDAKIVATTLFGGKYVSLTTPKNPTPQRLSAKHVIDARHVTTEINTLLQTVEQLTQKIDPVKVNLTLSAAAEALTGLGDKFGQSLVNANAILDEVNPLQPQARHDIQQLAVLADNYAKAAPDLLESLNSFAVVAKTLNAQQKDLDRILLSAVALGDTGSDIFGRGGPYLERVLADLVPTTSLLDTYSPELFCTLRNASVVEPKLANIMGAGDGYAFDVQVGFMGGTGLLFNFANLAGTAALGVALPFLFPLSLASLIGGVQNPYVWPDNLPRMNVHGGPHGAPGCYAPVTKDLWPAPYLVVDDGASLAPYNHLDTGSPLGTEYVWGRQWGELTINP